MLVGKNGLVDSCLGTEFFLYLYENVNIFTIVAVLYPSMFIIHVLCICLFLYNSTKYSEKDSKPVSNSLYVCVYLATEVSSDSDSRDQRWKWLLFSR